MSDKLRDALPEIETLLRKYGCDFHANRAGEARGVLEQAGAREACQHIAKLGWLGV